MGCLGSKDKLTKEDMDFLKSHTRYDEQTIKEWYKGFKVSKRKKCRFIQFMKVIWKEKANLIFFSNKLRLFCMFHDVHYNI